MSMDWGDVWKSAVGAAEDVIQAKAPAAKKYVRGILEAREERLRLLMVAWADHALDESALERELEEEREIAAMELLAIEVMVKKAAQDAVNAMFEVIEDALLKGIDLVV